MKNNCKKIYSFSQVNAISTIYPLGMQHPEILDLPPQEGQRQNWTGAIARQKIRLVYFESPSYLYVEYNADRITL